MSWSSVGSWIKGHAGSGAALVGSLAMGNIPAAVAAGVSLISSATGTDDPEKALETLQTDPAALVKLKELYYENEADIRRHIADVKRMELEDAQKEHETTQVTIQMGDKASDRLIRWTRPLQSWASLIATIGYVAYADTPSIEIVLAGLTLPWAYAGLRQVGKGIDSAVAALTALKK